MTKLLAVLAIAIIVALILGTLSWLFIEPDDSTGPR